MLMKAEITITYENKNESKAVAEAVSPDNIKVPEGLKIKTWPSNVKVKTLITYKGEKLGTFISTIDDLLACITAVEKTFSTVKKLSQPIT